MKMTPPPVSALYCLHSIHILLPCQGFWEGAQRKCLVSIFVIRKAVGDDISQALTQWNWQMKWHWAVDNACLMEVALGLTPSCGDIMPWDEICSEAFLADAAVLDNPATLMRRKKLMWSKVYIEKYVLRPFYGSQTVSLLSVQLSIIIGTFVVSPLLVNTDWCHMLTLRTPTDKGSY